MNLCWMARERDVCFVHLGKAGDIILMLPAFKRVADELGKPVICVVSGEYASIFEGVSYVNPWVVNLHWWKGVGKAKQMAIDAGFQPIVVKWWDEEGASPPLKLDGGRLITLSVHGKPVTIQANEWDSFQASQWRYAGFTMEQMMTWPLVFDRRDAQREEQLRQMWFRSNQPKLLVNLSTGGTSPFKEAQQAFAFCYGQGMEIVNLSKIRAARIYDLLGLYDHAAGLVTSDTATLHLAPASKIPYIALINNGGAGSIPRGNCVLAMRYDHFRPRMGMYIEALKKMGREAIAA